MWYKKRNTLVIKLSEVKTDKSIVPNAKKSDEEVGFLGNRIAKKPKARYMVEWNIRGNQTLKELDDGSLPIVSKSTNKIISIIWIKTKQKKLNWKVFVDVIGKISYSHFWGRGKRTSKERGSPKK